VNATKVIIDTDTGVDDAMAVVHALLDPRLDVVALTSVFGNVDVEQTTRNTLAILEVLGREDVPVAKGAAKGLVGEPIFSPHVHGADGVGDAALPEPTIQAVDETAAELIVRLAHEQPGELTLVPIGPLTNLALALELEPKLPELVPHVVWMGGVVERPGNVTPVAEADAWHDPEGADRVFATDWRITMVGLDVTDVTLMDEADFARMSRADTPAARYLTAITPFYMDFYESVLGFRACAMHSALTTAIAADPSLVTRRLHAPVRVELSGTLTRGMTVADRRGLRAQPGREVDIPLEVDVEAFKRLFFELVCRD
jgi:purine nucleosidase